MKIFDLVGGAFVLVWFVLVGQIAWKEYRPVRIVENTGSRVQLTPGESWMLLRREDAEIGFVHETRTLLGDEDWLFEYTLFINVEPIGAVDSEIRSTMRSDGVLRTLSSTTRLGKKEVTLSGEVEGNILILKSSIESLNKTITLKKPPKLSSNVYRTLANIPNLQKGDIIEEDFFDAISIGMNKMVFEYVEEKELEILEEMIPTRHFIQNISGEKLGVFIDKEGGVVAQEFPFRIIGSRVPNVLGRTRAHVIRAAAKNKGTGIDLDLGTRALFNKSKPNSFFVRGVKEADGLSLNGASQRLIKWKSDGAMITTSENSPSVEITESERENLVKATPRIDFDAPAFDDFSKQNIIKALSLSEEEVNPKMWSAEILRILHGKFRKEKNVAILSASTVWVAGKGDCTEYAIVMVAALRRAGFPARFVYGVKSNDAGKFIAHQWVEFWDGKQFYEVDPSLSSGEVDNHTIRFFVSEEPEAKHFLSVLSRVKISPIEDRETKVFDSIRNTDFN